jgi:Cu2+-exporting ATPase
LIAAVRAAGYEAVPDAAEPARALRRKEARQSLWRLFVAAFCAMQVMMMATPSYVAGAGDLAPDMAQLLNWGSWLLTLPVLAFSSVPFFRGAWRSLRTRRIGMDVPVALGIAITFVASSGATFAPGGVFGHEVYFDSLTMFVAFLLGSRWVEMKARHRAAETLEASLARLPATAWRLDDEGRAEAVSVHRLRPGDRVRVPLGEAFPADGELLAGRTQADESLLSGESAPVDKPAGAALVAGSVNLGAAVVMRVQRVGADTRFEAIVSMMKSAATQRPALARVADRWAAPFLWVVLLLAAGGAAAWSVIDPSRALWVAVAVLIVTCPCALSLAAPATLVAAVRALARRGVLVQRLDAIEALARAEQVFFDKTGTLTADRMALRQVHLSEPGQREFGAPERALAQAAALAAASNHPLSQALVAAAGADACAAGDVWEHAGQGLLHVDPQGREWRLGAPGWAGRGLAPAAHVVLAVDAQVLASFEFEEELRVGAAEAVAALRAEGVRVTLLTGDQGGRATALALRLGITEVVAGATPESKLAVLAEAQRQGRRVAMVGDGVNDAPVLARADVSLAMGQGALVSRAQADAVIASGRLDDLVAARRAAARALAIVRQNFAWAAAYNALCIPLALAGWLPPWAAGLGMATSSLVVVANATRAAR